MNGNGLAKTEDKDLKILQLKLANIELAIENMELQRINLAFKIQQIKPEYDRLAVQLKEKE